MSCDDFLPLISAHLDGANSEIEERRLQEHLKTCEFCRTLLSQMEQNDTLLKANAAVPPADLTERIMREVRKEEKASSPRKRYIISTVASGLAVAALLSLVIFGKFSLTGFTKSDKMYPASQEGFADSEADLPFDTVYSAYAEGSTQEAFSATSAKTVVSTTDMPEEAATEKNADAPLISLPQPTELAALTPDFPAYGAFPESTEEPTSAKRHGTRYTPSAPMLIVWNASNPDTLADFEPEELNDYAPFTANVAPSLYSHFLTAVPLLRDFDQIFPADGFGITVYTVPYEIMMATFNECIGVYENAIYYPIDFSTPGLCSVVLIGISE